MSSEDKYLECPKCERQVKEDDKECPYCKYDLVNRPKIEKEKGPMHTKWWIWMILGAILSIVIVSTNNSNNTNDVASANTSNKINVVTNTAKNINTNPYEKTNEYNGIYKFVLNSNNGTGHIFTAKGAILFKDGICEAKYMVNSDTISEYNREYSGFCGINKDDNYNFYFSLNDNEIIYQCSKTNSNLSCKLKSKYDLCGCSNGELILSYVDNSQTIDKVLAQVVEEERIKKEAEEKAKQEKEEQDFKASCKTYTFEQIARNPTNFKGTNVKLTGEVVQVMQDGYSTNLRVNITKTGKYYTDTVYVVYHQKTGEDRILENDIITFYGTSQGDCSYKTVLGANITLPNIKANYITINK